MADMTFVDKQTTFTVDWSQDVNDAAYRAKNLVYATSTGAANVFTVTKSTNLKAAFAAGDEFEFKAHQSNTVGASTFNFITSVGTLTASIAYAGSTTLPAGIITSGQIIRLAYDGTNMLLPYVGALAIDSAEIKASAITTAKINDLAVTTAKINDQGVTYAKLQNVAASSLVGNSTGGSTSATAIPLIAPLAFVSSSLSYSSPLTQCRLSLSAGSLLLSRRDGSYLWINGQNQSIPSAGVTLAIGAAAANSPYYIYAYMSTGTMTLEFSSTVPAIDTTTGMPIKNGDATRTLVGQAATTAAPAWADSATQRFTLSYWNRVEKGLLNSYSSNRSTSNTSYTELNTEIRVQFITWGDEVVKAWADGAAQANNNNVQTSSSLGVDGTTAQDCFSAASQDNVVGNKPWPVALTLPPQTLSEASLHYITLLGKTSSDTSTWLGSGTAGVRCTIKGVVRG